MNNYPMRVLHVYNLHRGGGGADNAALATINAQRENGIEVETFVRDSRDIPLNLSGKLRAFLTGLYARDAVASFKQCLDSFQPDIVHIYELYPLISPWILPECSKRKIKVVMSVYDYRLTCPVHSHHYHGETCTKCIGGHEHHCFTQNCRDSRAESLAFALRNWVGRYFGLFLKHVDCYITPTSFTANWLTEHTEIKPEQVDVVPCLIDIPETTVNPAEGKYIAFAGRFVAEKGVDVAIAAARKAGLPLWLAGDSENCHDLKDADDIHYVTTHNAEELAAFYRGAKMTVMPSIWFETFGIVVGESMSHGVPVLASNIGALAETTLNGITGLLFETGNSEDLATKMRLLWDDDNYCQQLGAGARKHIQQTASADVYYKNIFTVYEKMLRRPAVHQSQ